MGYDEGEVLIGCFCSSARNNPMSTVMIPIALIIERGSFRKIMLSIVPNTGTASWIVPVVVAVSVFRMTLYR